MYWRGLGEKQAEPTHAPGRIGDSCKGSVPPASRRLGASQKRPHASKEFQTGTGFPQRQIDVWHQDTDKHSSKSLQLSCSMLSLSLATSGIQEGLRHSYLPSKKSLSEGLSDFV